MSGWLWLITVPGERRAGHLQEVTDALPAPPRERPCFNQRQAHEVEDSLAVSDGERGGCHGGRLRRESRPAWKQDAKNSEKAERVPDCGNAPNVSAQEAKPLWCASVRESTASHRRRHAAVMREPARLSGRSAFYIQNGVRIRAHELADRSGRWTQTLFSEGGSGANDDSPGSSGLHEDNRGRVVQHDTLRVLRRHCREGKVRVGCGEPHRPNVESSDGLPTDTEMGELALKRSHDRRANSRRCGSSSRRAATSAEGHDDQNARACYQPPRQPGAHRFAG